MARTLVRVVGGSGQSVRPYVRLDRRSKDTASLTQHPLTSQSSIVRRCTRKFFEHTCCEIHHLSSIQNLMIMVVCALWAVTSMQAAARVAGHTPTLAGFLPQSLACLGISTLAALAAAMPRTCVRLTGAQGFLCST